MRVLGRPAISLACSSLARLLTTTAAEVPALSLVRDFVHDSLYNPSYGYFSAQLAPVGTLPRPMNFSSFYGQQDYFKRVQEIYTQLQVSWLTPVEIFQPHYGSAIASYLAQHHAQQQQQHAQRQGQRGQQQRGQQQWRRPLQIYEIGGGRGTLARNILDWLREHRPSLYSSCRYVCVEISPTLAKLQRRRVAEEGGHSSCFEVVQQDAASAAAWGGAASGESCYVIMMEVLDNLTHDRVWRPYAGAPWQQTLVECSRQSSFLQQQQQQQGQQHEEQAGSAETYREVLQPVSDPLILRCLECLEQQAAERAEQQGSLKSGWNVGALREWVAGLVQGSAGEAAFLPTGCLALLDTLHSFRPAHHLVAADFDALPEVVIKGYNAPLVATTIGGRTIDHGTYLVPRGSADIFFPTDFDLLQRLYANAAEHAWQRRRSAWQQQQGQRRGQKQQQRRQQQHGPTSGSSGSITSGSPLPGEASAQQHSMTPPSDPAAAGAAHMKAAGAARMQAAEAVHMKTAEFMLRYADLAATTTRSGYNPLLQDYSNSAFFLGTAQGAAEQ